MQYLLGFASDDPRNRTSSEDGCLNVSDLGACRLPGAAVLGRSTHLAPSPQHGAYLGHGAGDSKGQQGSLAATRDLALTSANAQEQQLLFGHALYGMQGVIAR